MLHSRHLAALAIAAGVSVSAGAASAATAAAATTSIEPGDDIFALAPLNPGSSVEYNFRAEEDLEIATFSVTANGFSGGSDIQNLTFGIRMQDGTERSTTFSQINRSDRGSLANADAFFPGITLARNETFTFFFADGGNVNAREVIVDLVFEVTDIAPVPLPAAGGMLLTAVLGGGLVARRKKKSA